MRKKTTKNQESTQEASPQTEPIMADTEKKEQKKARKPRAKKSNEKAKDGEEKAEPKKRGGRSPKNVQKAPTAKDAQPEEPKTEVAQVETAETTAEAMTEVAPNAENAAPNAENTAPIVEQSQPVKEQSQPVAEKKESIAEKKEPKEAPAIRIPVLPEIVINDIVELSQAPQRSIVLTDQQIQLLTLEEIEKRYTFLEQMLTRVLDYDVVISDTNIWLELLIGHTSSHSDPRYNARLQFERQMEFISKLTKHRGGRFMMMGETYEEIDRFASMQDPANHKDADFTDNIVCLNTAARLAKRLILAQQRENRLRIEGIGAESHHASFADPAIIKKVAELFAEGKKVLLLTNDASVAIRSMGICDDLQRINGISDNDWNERYAPLRPMVFTFDDLKLLDYYTRQYYYIQMAAGKQWMQNIGKAAPRQQVEKLTLCDDAFRPGDKHRGDNLNTEQEKDRQPHNTQLSQKAKQQQNQQKQKQQQAQQKQKQQQKNEQPQQKQEQVLQKQEQTAPEVKPEVAAPVQEAQKAEEPVAETATKQEQKPKQKSRRRPQRPKQQKPANDAPQQAQESAKPAE